MSSAGLFTPFQIFPPLQTVFDTDLLVVLTICIRRLSSMACHFHWTILELDSTKSVRRDFSAQPKFCLHGIKTALRLVLQIQARMNTALSFVQAAFPTPAGLPHSGPRLSAPCN